MKHPIFKGVATALVTPMNGDGSVNYKRLETLVEELEAKKVEYNNKKSSGDEAAEELNNLKIKIKSIGYEIVTDRGDRRKEK